jgi:flagellar hook-associated protein 3 FlgL
MIEAVRVTPTMLDTALISSIDANEVNLADLEQEAASGERINSPSDHPAEIATVLAGQALAARTQQYEANATDGLAYLGIASSAMNQVLSIVQQVRSLVASVSATSQGGTGVPTQAIAEQVQNLRSDVLTLANTTYLGHPVFGGTTGGPVAFDAAGNYVGTTTVPTRTVGPGVQIPVGIVGSAAFGTSGTTGTGLFAVLYQIVQDLNAGNLNAVETTDATNLDNAIQVVLAQAQQIGALYDAIQAAQTQTQALQTTIADQVSNLRDANMAKVLTELSTAQNDYEAALWATAKVTQTTLAQFLA